jgi:hypothetical protein
MLIAMTGAAQTRRELDQAPTQTLNFLDCRLKNANVLRKGLTDSIDLQRQRIS